MLRCHHMPSSIESFQETMTSTDKVPETDKLVISIGECLENIKLFQGSSVSSQKQRNDSILLTRNLMKRWKSFFFFWWYWGLNSRSCSYYAGALSIQSCPQPFLLLIIFQIGSHIFLLLAPGQSD
jgi:hypothetical protein